ncbi:MAG: ABC transporter permease [Desulfobacterales bacterium]|nr:ABC transporter permease [Deltaproteobacteria bacterium]NNL77155.1 ABC transporter permease [Desulfobacterales bacterium]
MIRFRLVKRKPLPGWAKIVIPITAIIVTLILSAIPILMAGGQLWKSYFYLFYGALGTRFNFLETFVKASPLLLTGLAVAFAFRAKFWNIGAEGQLLAGALMATVLGVHMGGFPQPLVLPVIIIAGFIAGGIWAAIPAILKTKLKVDDVVSTLLLNYVMVHIMGALLFGPLQQPGSSWPRSAAIIKAATYPILMSRSRFHMGILLAFLAVFVIWFINQRTTFGYQSKAVGVNIRAAHFGGINTTGVILWTALISGGLAGLAGVGELCAIQYRLIMDISPGYGYSGIVIAMLGNLHPVGVLFSSLFFSVIIVGAQTMSRMTGVPTYIAEVIQGMALMVMLIFLLFTEFKIRVVRK